MQIGARKAIAWYRIVNLTVSWYGLPTEFIVSISIEFARALETIFIRRHSSDHKERYKVI